MQVVKKNISLSFYLVKEPELKPSFGHNFKDDEYK